MVERRRRNVVSKYVRRADDDINDGQLRDLRMALASTIASYRDGSRIPLLRRRRGRKRPSRGAKV